MITSVDQFSDNGGIFISSHNVAKQQLAKLARRHGFTVKRNCCYRVTSGGVLQLLKIEYDPRFSLFEINIGLYSLYSELSPHWLTPGGCILRYPVVALAGIQHSDDISIDTQISILRTAGFTWLDTITNQCDLVQAMCDIETHLYGKTQWIDSFKIAPFLILGDYVSAKRVIVSILQQHVGPDYWTTESWTESDYEEYKIRYPDQDKRMLEILDWIHLSNNDAINDYLKSNFTANAKQIDFIHPTFFA